MPLYEFECECGKFTEFFKLKDFRRKITCKCGREAKLIISPVKSKVFRTQHLHGVETGLEETAHIVRNKQDVIDARNRYNDSQIATKQGKVSIME